MVRKGLIPFVLLVAVSTWPTLAEPTASAGSADHREALEPLIAAKEQAEAGGKPDVATVDSFPGSEVERLTAAGLGKFSQGDFAGAINEYSNAIKINPKRGGLYLQRGLSYLELENYEPALEDLDRAYELDRSNKLAILVCRGRALSGLAKYDRSLSDLDEAIAEDPKFVLAYISRADTYLSKGDDEKALADLEQAISLDPKQSRAYLLRARCYKHQNKNDLALNDFNTAISLDSSFLDRDYSVTQSDKELRDHFSKALKIGRGKLATAHLLERGMALERNGEYLEAIRELTDAISDSPDSLEAYKWRASVYMHMSSFDHAIDDLNKAIVISPKDPTLQALRAKAYLDLGQNEKAIEGYSKAVELSESPPSTLFEARGLVYSRLGKSNEAIADFSRAIETDPAGSLAYADRGLEYIVHKRYQEALADFTESIGRGHDLAVCYKFRGQSKFYLGDLKGAISDLEKAAQFYKNQNDLFGCRQVERMIGEFKKGNNKA